MYPYSKNSMLPRLRLWMVQAATAEPVVEAALDSLCVCTLACLRSDASGHIGEDDAAELARQIQKTARIMGERQWLERDDNGGRTFCVND